MTIAGDVTGFSGRASDCVQKQGEWHSLLQARMYQIYLPNGARLYLELHSAAGCKTAGHMK